MDVNNLRVALASLCLGASLLIGCGGKEVNKNEIVFGNSISISYENEIPAGTISYEDLNKYIKVVKLNHQDINKTFLVIKDEIYHSGGRFGSSSNEIKYIDLETGTTIIEYADYTYDDKENTWVVGDNLIIEEEKDITGYLLQEDFIKKEYTFEELLDFYNEKIISNLDGNKELIKK